MFRGECPRGGKMPCFLWQRLQLTLPWKQLGLEREERERDKGLTFLLQPERFMPPQAGNISRCRTQGWSKAVPEPSSRAGHKPHCSINHCSTVRASHDTFHVREATGGWHLPVAWPGADRIPLSYPAVGLKCPLIQTVLVCSSCGPANTNRHSLTICWEAQVQNTQKKDVIPDFCRICMCAENWMCHLLISEYLTLSPSDSKQEGLVSFIYICLWIIKKKTNQSTRTQLRMCVGLYVCLYEWMLHINSVFTLSRPMFFSQSSTACWTFDFLDQSVLSIFCCFISHEFLFSQHKLNISILVCSQYIYINRLWSLTFLCLFSLLSVIQ